MPPTLGQRLQHAREKRGLSLQDVAHRTKIPVPRLQDLEDNNLTSFGSLTYAKSFLRTYADLLEVNADEVLNQLHQPPLGGLRDYRYLVESHGPWVTDKTESHAIMAPVPRVSPGRSFAFALLVCLVFGLLIGGGVLANAYFNTRPQPSATITGTETARADTFQARTTAGEQSNLSPEAFLAPSAGPREEDEFTIFGVSFTLVPNSTPSAAPVPVPKAQPVPENFKAVSQPAAIPPKAEAVR